MFSHRLHNCLPAALHLLLVFFLALVATLWAGTARAQEAECAEVKIVIEQKLSLERQAFDAHMVIRNDLEEPLSDVRVELIYQDQEQNPVVATTDPNAVGAVFFQRLDRADGINSLDAGTLSDRTTADIHWLIIPSQGAGGDTAEGKLYYIGAKLSYTLRGETTTVDVTPDYVIVRPQPLLELDYFLPTDVYGDDPMTAAVEPVEPFTLGVRVSNVGAGVSRKTTIESAQPKIVENHQGLLIDFRILGAWAANEMLGKSLLINFGDIPPQSAAVGRWLMETTLAGQFTEFNASFSHADSLGGAVTSLIRQVRAHKLVHDVLVDLPGHDDVYDFLAEFGVGYRVYDSGGGDAEVADVSPQARLSRVSGSSMKMTFPVSHSLVHAKVSDPFAGGKSPTRVVRSDGKILPPQNFWLSKTRNENLSWSYYLHIFDTNSTGEYLIEFGQGGTASLSGLAWLDANANGVRDAGEAAQGGLDVTLAGTDANGQGVLLQTQTNAGGVFSFSGVQPGRYRIEAATLDGWVDGAWAAGSAGGVALPGLIDAIVLTAGTVADGYHIVKRRPQAVPPEDDDDENGADVSLAISTSRQRLHAGEEANITVTVQNAGPEEAQSVTVQLAIPGGLALQNATASAGSHANGVWSVGTLAKGQSATLTLTVKAEPVTGNDDRAITWPVRAGASSRDPQAGNNAATLALTVLAEQAKVEMAQELPARASVLFMADCTHVPAEGRSGCEQQAAQRAQDILGAQAYRFTAASALADWNAAQRTGAYNVFWLHGGAGTLDEQALAELGAAVRRGAALLVDGLPDATQPIPAQMTSVLGAEPGTTSLGTEQEATLAESGQALAVAGELYGLQLRGAQAVAFAAGTQTPVISSSIWGLGRALAFGFDALAAAQGASSTPWQTFIGQKVQALTPLPATSPALAGARLPVRTAVTSRVPDGGESVDVSVTMQWSQDVSASEVTPTPERSESQQLAWNWRLAPGQSETGELTLTMPSHSANVVVQTALEGDGETLDTAGLAIDVIALDTFTEYALGVVQALDVDGNAAQEVKEQAQQAAQQAAQAQERGDWEAALASLAAVQTALDTLAADGALLDEARLDVARWIGLVQQEWAPEGNPEAASVTVVAGANQTATVLGAFAAPLQVRVDDAQGQPLAGVTVTFSAPAVGASAVFEGGRQAAHAVTDEQGIATSPPLQANATVGNYEVLAQVDGLEPVFFALANAGSGGGGGVSGLRLRAVGGFNQNAFVRMAYGQRISVRVENARGRPQEGVLVRFTFPQSGASARFDGSGVEASAVTNAKGVAVSPPFTANAHAGRFSATISAEGAATPLQATLNNFALPGIGRYFHGLTSTGTGTMIAFISGGGARCAFDPLATYLMAPDAIPSARHQAFRLPHGLFAFALVGCEHGSEVTVTTAWPELNGVTGYMKYGPTHQSAGQSTWYAPTGVHMDGNTVSYIIRDGGAGDDDMTVDGEIHDPSGPIIKAGGTSAPAAVPTLGQWALLLLSALLGVAAVRRRAR